MLPEFIGLFIGIFACWVLAGSYVLWNMRKSRREQLRLLHENLNQVNLAWSHTEPAIKPAESVEFTKETQSEKKWFLLAGAILSVASWLGFLVLGILIISLEYLAKPPVERALFKTDLVRRKLPPGEVQKIVSNIAP